MVGISPVTTPPNTEAPATPAEPDTESPTVWVTVSVPRIVVSVVRITQECIPPPTVISRVIVCTETNADVGPAVEMERVTARLGNHFPYPVLGHVVVEIGARRHGGCYVREIGLGIIEHVPGVRQSIIPMVVAREFVEAERIAGKRGVYRTYAAGCEDAKGLTIAPTADLEFATTPHEVVLDGIDRKQDAYAAIRLGMKHEQIPVRRDARVYPDTVAQPYLTPIEPDLHGKIGLLRENCRCSGVSSACCRDQEREECDAQHKYLQGADG